MSTDNSHINSPCTTDNALSTRNRIANNQQNGMVNKEDIRAPETDSDTRDYCISCNPQSGLTDSVIIGGKESNSSIQSQVVCDPTSTTCFVESDSLVKAHQLSVPLYSSVENRDMSIRDFLARPMMLATTTWTTAQVARTTLYSADQIGTLLTSVTQWAKKIEGFGLVRGTFIVRVEVNAAPFHAGALLLHYIPNYNTIADAGRLLKRVDGTLSAKFQRPHVLIDCRNTAAEIAMPWVSPYTHYAIKSPPDDWGRIALDVVAPLKSGPLAIANVDVTIYGYWEDFELCQSVIPQSNTLDYQPQARSRDRSIIENTPVIAKGLANTAKLVDQLSVIPMLSPLVTPVAAMIRFASGVASIFGWSKSIILDKVAPIVRQTYRYFATSDGTEVAVPLSLIHDNSTPISLSMSNTTEDEMSTAYLFSRAHYMNTFSWSNAQVSGTLLITRKLSPNIFFEQSTQTYAGSTATYKQGGPMFYLSSQFRYWRGSFNLHLRLVKTQYHTGRLQITWTPGTVITTTPTLTTSIHSLRQIIDIRDQTDIIINLPFLVAENFLNVEVDSATAPKFSGQLDILVLNELRSPETCSPNIDIIEWYTAGDDFEFNTPSISEAVSLQSPFQPQSGTQEVVATGIAESKIMSKTSLAAFTCMGEQFTSIKQLISRMNNPLCARATNPLNIPSLTIQPNYIGIVTQAVATGFLQYPQYYGDALHIYAPMYANYKGSININITTSSPDRMYANLTYGDTVSKVDDNYMIAVSETVVGTFVPSVSIASKRPMGNAGVSPVELTEYGGTFRVPYTNRLPFSHVKPYMAGEVLSTIADAPQMSLQLSSPAAFGPNAQIMRSCGDDFQLAYFIGCPPVLTSFV